VSEHEEEVDCPYDVWYFEYKPAKLGIDVDLGDGTTEPPVVDLDSSQHQPTNQTVKHDCQKGNGLER